MEDVHGARKLCTAIVDLGCRGAWRRDHPLGLDQKSLSAEARRLLKRRQTVGPVIGRLKHDCKLRWNWLKRSEGDVLPPVLCAAEYNLRLLM